MKFEDFDQMPLIQAAAIELTNHCNLKCSMCWSQSPRLYPARAKGYMDLELFEKTITELWAFSGYAAIRLSLSFMGESLLYPEFKQALFILREARRRGARFKPVIYTNGINLDKYAPDLVDSGVIVSVSIHNPVPDYLEHNVYAYLAERERQLPYYGHLNMPLTGAIVLDEFKDPRPVAEHWRGIVDYVDCYKPYTEDLQRTDLKSAPLCREAWYYLAVLWNGDTLPCCHVLSPGPYSLGNVKDGVLPVWMGDKYQTLRGGKLADSPCEHCHIHSGNINKVSI